MKHEPDELADGEHALDPVALDVELEASLTTFECGLLSAPAALPFAAFSNSIWSSVFPFTCLSSLLQPLILLSMNQLFICS